MVDPRYVSAKKVFDYYLERLEEDDSEESKWCLQFLNLQMAKHRANTMLTMLYSYPVSVSDV
jgi:hypothetical protein